MVVVTARFKLWKIYLKKTNFGFNEKKNDLFTKTKNQPFG